jgi:hypothetical protein
MYVAQNIACGIPKAQKDKKAPHRRKIAAFLSDRA